MIVRLFRATPKPGKAEELAELIADVSIPFVDTHPGLVGRFAGRGLGAAGEEIVILSVWETLEAMMSMTGEDWESAVIPDERLAERIAESSVCHYRTFD